MKVLQGDCISKMADMKPDSADAIVTDPPYGLEFMGQEWDSPHLMTTRDARKDSSMDRKNDPYIGAQVDRYMAGTPYQKWTTAWAIEALRVLKPGGFMVAFGGDRTHHRMMCGVEDAGFEIRTTICYLYGSGFPKSFNVSKNLDAILPASLRCACVPRSRDTGEGSQSGCHPECDLCDGQPLSVQDSDQATPPSPADAHGHNHVGPHEDGSCKGQEHNPGRFSIGHLSTGDCENLLERLEEDFPRFDSKLFDILTNRLRACLLERRKMERRKSDSSDSACDSVSSSPCSRPFIGDVTSILHRCDKCKCYYFTEGMGTALKPAWEPICVAQKPREGSFCQNVLKYGVGAVNVDECRIGTEPRPETTGDGTFKSENKAMSGHNTGRVNTGRFPANLILDEEAGRMLDKQSGVLTSGGGSKANISSTRDSQIQPTVDTMAWTPDTGGPSRFFYSSKATDRDDYNDHPTLKPTPIMEWLIRLVTRPGQTVLDPFAGSGTMGVAAVQSGREYVLIEQDEHYVEIIEKRLSEVQMGMF